jgi:hypothetical protein
MWCDTVIEKTLVFVPRLRYIGGYVHPMALVRFHEKAETLAPARDRPLAHALEALPLWRGFLHFAGRWPSGRWQWVLNPQSESSASVQI